MRRERLAQALCVVAILVVALAPVAFGAAKEGEEAKPGIINLNLTLLLQMVNFLILIGILYRFLFKPFTAFLAKRAEGIRQSLEEARLAREEAAKAQEAFQARLLATQREAQELREAALREVEEERQRLLRASREEAARLLAQARTEIDQEVKRAKATLQEEAVSLSVAVAERVIGRSLTEEDHRRLAEEFVEEVGRSR